MPPDKLEEKIRAYHVINDMYKATQQLAVQNPDVSSHRLLLHEIWLRWHAHIFVITSDIFDIQEETGIDLVKIGASYFHAYNRNQLIEFEACLDIEDYIAIKKGESNGTDADVEGSTGDVPPVPGSE